MCGQCQLAWCVYVHPCWSVWLLRLVPGHEAEMVKNIHSATKLNKEKVQFNFNIIKIVPLLTNFAFKATITNKGVKIKKNK